MSQNPADFDPFASDSAPSLSFADAPVGTVKSLVVTKDSDFVQGRDYETNEPAFWPLSDSDRAAGKTVGNPKMCAVVVGTMVDTGEERSIWATKPSSLFSAIGAAQRTLGRRVRPGDTIHIKFASTKKSDNPRKADQKIYEAIIEGGTPPATNADPFAGGGQAGAPAQQQVAPVQQAAPAAANPFAAASAPAAQQAPAQQGGGSPWDGLGMTSPAAGEDKPPY